MMKWIVLSAVLMTLMTPAFAQQIDPDKSAAKSDWFVAARSYATAGMCAKKRFAFSSGDVEKLKKIAVERAKSVDQSVIDEWWDFILVTLSFAPPTAEDCFDEFEKADFTGLGGLPR